MMFVAYRLSEYELSEVDTMVQWFAADAIARAKRLRKKVITMPSEGSNLDNIEAISAVRQLHSCLSIVALWRCVELCRSRVLLAALSSEASREAAYHTKAMKRLKQIGIAEGGLESWKAVDELRCLNNSFKHGGYIQGSLAKFATWVGREGEELSNVDIEYPRLRKAAGEYIKDLTLQASKWLMSPHL